MTGTTYQRPISAELHVHLENGETWKATDEDFEQFGLVAKLTAYSRFSRALSKTLIAAGLIERDKDLTNAELNPLRYLVENAVVMPDLLDQDYHGGWADVAEIERRLRDFVSLHDVVARLADMWDSSIETRAAISERYGPLGHLIDEAKGVVDRVAPVEPKRSDDA